MRAHERRKLSKNTVGSKEAVKHHGKANKEHQGHRDEVSKSFVEGTDQNGSQNR